MIIYEVNLKISSDIFNDYYVWLKKHLEEMLKFKGFMTARVFKNLSEKEQHFEKITIQYEIQTLENLNDYLNNFAETMRSKGVKIFEGKFTATRRILDLDSFQPAETENVIAQSL